MTYGQQPDPQSSGQQPQVPPVPPAPGGPPAYNAPGQTSPGAPSQGGAPSYGASSGGQSYGGASAPGYGASSAPGAPGYGGGAPWAGGAMPRPGTVTAGSILAFIGGGFMVVIGLILALAGGSGALDDMDMPGFGGGLGGLFVGLGLVVLLFGALVIFFGVMAFKGKRWGAIALAVLAGLSLIGGISGIAQGDGSGLVGVAWGITSAVLLLLAPSQAYYRSKS